MSNRQDMRHVTAYRKLGKEGLAELVGECMEQPLSMRASGGAKIQMAQGRLISGSPSR